MPPKLIKPLVFTLALAPLAWLVYAALTGHLGVNPIETVTRSLGDWALRFLLLTLAVTPLRKLTGWRWPMRFRRMLGLYAFLYTTLHLAGYIVLDQFFYWPGIWEDILKRPYITVGMVSFLMLIPLAVTSTSGMMRRLGKNWQRLHRLVYPIAIGGVLHYYMLVKADTREPLIYATILLVLLLLRLPSFQRPPRRFVKLRRNTLN
ncbi:MAG: protein-methionine-sulfoxide reductase heme-binding subunit MsrQ [Gammaproteobacteria bacterium]|nr:protein-methionine-sulfoxide reductase heme-binding subunit MsrQ [Gammaproteobacteria bacterium]MCW8841703.1 protein-methionine-sulfoxide reductase heme-binding subunit MsrQ [Gammaproteobacteria bacterium]MCW8927269.1 protein-methionine-sulfoxide reductase heme-binding subunit MsrQ [Gammaproteobacteria bacterium]MCW8958873.1 protein-methionine-sulfoxide reductase heme-binding subunit MsrQ [Gammaproteobacteria bacterium]MCW8971699.1 protein-methionine-sulfoxide reductase heme-binding subunit 